MKRFRYLILRRCVQILLLALFICPDAGYILRGDFSASTALNSIPLAEPFAVIELFFASGEIAASALIGALIIALIYALLGRVFCSWVCPVNLLSNLAEFLRRILGLKSATLLKKSARYYLLAGVLLFALIMKVPLWQQYAHYSMLARGIIYAQISVIGLAILIIVIDMKFKNFTCSHFCPLGAFYAILGRFAWLKVRYKKDACNACGKCLKICPEAQVLELINKHSGSVKSGECIRCARCIEVCEQGALEFNLLHLKKDKK